MKTAKDPRHIRRIKLMQELFSWNFNQQHGSKEIADIISNLETIDDLISQAAPDRPFSEINRIDLAILRLAIFELIIKDTPTKVVVDEAIELGKEFGSDSSGAFINGALGKVIKIKHAK